MRSETKFGSEDCLSLQTCPLTDEKVVEIVLQRLLVDVEDLATQVQAQASIRPFDESRIRVLNGFAFVVDVFAPTDGIANL